MFEKIGGVNFWVQYASPFGKVIRNWHSFIVSGHVDMLIIPDGRYIVMIDRLRLVSFQNFISAYRYALEIAVDRHPDFNGDNRIFYQF